MDVAELGLSSGDNTPVRGLYHVPWLEKWADSHAMGLHGRDVALKSASAGVERQLQEAVKQMPTRNQVENVDGLGRLELEDVGMDAVEEVYRSSLDVRPGIFALVKDEAGTVSLHCDAKTAPQNAARSPMQSNERLVRRQAICQIWPALCEDSD